MIRQVVQLCMLVPTLAWSASVAHSEYRTIGTIAPQYRAVLGSQVAGRVEEVYVEVGGAVRAGDPIVKLDQTLFAIAVAEASAAAQSARIEYDDASCNFERMQKLFDKPEGRPSISQKRFEDAQHRRDQACVAVARAEEALKRARKQESETIVYAPFAGVVVKRFVHPGESVANVPATKIIELVSTEHSYVEFSVPQKYASQIRLGMPVRISIDGVLQESVERPLDRICPDIDEKTRSMKCRASFDTYVCPGALAEVILSLCDQGE